MSVRITFALHQFEQRRAVVHIDAGLQSFAAEGRDGHLHPTSWLAPAAERFAQRIFNDCGQCLTRRRRDSLRLGQEMGLEPNCGCSGHCHQSMLIKHQYVKDAGLID